MSKSGDPLLDAKVCEWLNWDKNKDSHAFISSLAEKKDVVQLKIRLMNRLAFGTAGLRGEMGPGYSYMNDLVIIQTTQGLARYVEKTCPDAQNKGVVVGYDGRHNSYRFAQLTAGIFLSLGIPVFLYSKMCPTPFVPYAVLQCGCDVGIMVTASHNPKDDNGYKVYWSNGAQIISPHDKGIQQSIEDNLEPWPSSWDDNVSKTNSLCKDPLNDMMIKYFTHIKTLSHYCDLNASSSLKFTYTPMHGVGYLYMLETIKSFRLKPFVIVEQQKDPDPEFPTVKFPNPEEGKSALDLAIQTANDSGSSVILANDPDADRLAVAEKQPSGEWRVFTGNDIGALLGWWLWKCHKLKNPDDSGSDVYMIASTVSSKLLRAIAKKERFNFIETLTGFKWMGNKSDELIQQGKTILFAFEEAIGFMCGTAVLDKDGVCAAGCVAEMAIYLHEKEHLSLTEKLESLHETYGYHIGRNSYFICHDQPSIQAMFARLRNWEGTQTYPNSCGRFNIKNIRDLTVGYDDSQPDKKAILPSSKSSEMITFTFENGCVLTLRTSGTEPKVKYYTEMCGEPGQSNRAALEVELDELVQKIIEEFMQPQFNKFIPKSD